MWMIRSCVETVLALPARAAKGADEGVAQVGHAS